MEKQEASAVLMDTVVSKLEQQQQKIQTQEKRIEQVEEGLQKKPDFSADIKEMKTGLQNLKIAVDSQQFPTKQVQELSKQLTTSITLMRQPVENTTQHHHHIPKLIWAAGGLFLLLCLVCSGWYMTASTIGQYKANDTKYRRLKLRADTVLLKDLWRLDSTYSANPDSMRSVVEEQERLKQQRLELLDQIERVNSKIEQSPQAGEKKKNGH